MPIKCLLTRVPHQVGLPGHGDEQNQACYGVNILANTQAVTSTSILATAVISGIPSSAARRAVTMSPPRRSRWQKIAYRFAPASVPRARCEMQAIRAWGLLLTSRIVSDNSFAVCKPEIATKAQPIPPTALLTSAAPWLITSPVSSAAPTKPSK